MADEPAPPERTVPDESWEHFQLYARVREALYALPLYFKTETVITGIMATDIFTLNAALGATIEEQVVRTLNEMRPIWDSGDEYKSIATPTGVTPYPKKADRIVDKPVSDAGRNFGRFARTGLMDEYLEITKAQPLSGIEARYWLRFFKAFQEQKTTEDIEAELARLTTHISETYATSDETLVQRVETILSELRRIILDRD